MLSFTYQAARRDASIENATQAVPDAQVQDKTTKTPPTNDMTWSGDIVSNPDAVVGIVVAAVFCLLVAVAVCYCLCKMKKKPSGPVT